MNKSSASKTIFANILLFVLLFILTDISAQTVISQWSNGYISGNPPADGKFLATGGIALNKGIAVLTRETTSGITFAVNTDGCAASRNWDNAGNNEKYWIAVLNTTGYETLTLTSKQMGSTTGPKNFRIEYSTGTSEIWNTLPGAEEITVTGSFAGINLALPVTMEDRPSVSLRWVCTSNTSINEGSISPGNGVNRLDVVVSGTAKSGIVDPVISTSATTLRFTTPNNTKTFAVKASNLNEQIGISGDNSFFFITPSKLPATGGNVTVRFIGTTAQTGKITLQSGNAKAFVNLIAMNSETGNDGTKEHPLTVAEGTTYQGSTDTLWVKGYIVGAVKATKNSVSSADDVFIGVTSGFDSSTNVLIADDVNETDYKNCIAVNLTTSPLRTDVSLVGHKENIRKLLNIKGVLKSYFGLPGSRDNNGNDYILGNATGLKPATQPEINVYVKNGTIFVENLMEVVNNRVYDLTGKLVVETTATEIPLAKGGIYIVKVGAKAFKVVKKT